MEVLSCKSPTLKHISEISYRPVAFPGKVTCWTGMSWFYSRNSCPRIPRWIEGAYCAHSLARNGSGEAWNQHSQGSSWRLSICPCSRFTRRKSLNAFSHGHHIHNLYNTDTFVHSCPYNTDTIVHSCSRTYPHGAIHSLFIRENLEDRVWDETSPRYCSFI